MAATLTSLNVALQRVWTQKTLEEQLYNKTPFLDRVQKTSRYTVGETARVPLHVSRNGGYTALPAGGGNLNTAGNQGLNKAEYNYTNHHQQVAIQGDAIDGTDGNSNSVVQAVDLEVNGALTDIRRQLERQLFSNGDALIAPCRTSSSNNVDLNTTSGAHAISRGWLFVGMPVDVGTTSSEASIVDNSLITAIDATNSAVTVASGNITTESTSEYISQANSRSGTTSYEMNGLKNICSATSTLGGLAPATEAKWAASVDSTTTTLTLSAILQRAQAIHQVSGDEPDFLLTGLQQSRKFYELLQQQVRYGSDSSLDAGNQTTPKYNGMEIWRHPDCPDQDLYQGHFKHFFILALDKPYWQNKVTGGEILSWIQGTDAYGAKLTYRVQLGVNRRNIFSRMSALT